MDHCLLGHKKTGDAKQRVTGRRPDTRIVRPVCIDLRALQHGGEEQQPHIEARPPLGDSERLQV